MAHKNAAESRRIRNKPVNGDLKTDCNNCDRMPEKCSSEKDIPAGDISAKSLNSLDNDAEITGRFIDVDETDHAVPNFTKIHVLKTRSSSEQNLMLKTSSLRKGKYLSSSLLYNGTQNESDKLNNNFSKEEFSNRNVNETLGYQKPDLEQNFDRNNVDKICDKDDNCDKKAEEESRIQVSKGKSESECKELCDLIKAVSNGHTYKKNSNVYSVFQAKTVVSERRRSLPSLPKLIGQKINEHSQRVLSKSEGGADSSAFGNKDFKARTFRTLSKGIGRLLKRHSSVNISEPDPVFKVAYLGNVLTGWAKGEGCVDKPLATLWRNYNQSSKPDVVMKLSITNSGLKGVTKEHGLTEYWAHRITFCTSPPEFPKIFCWIYRHEGRKLKHELRCHAVLCTKELTSKKITTELQSKIQQALLEFKRDKISRQNARLSLANSIYDNPSMPRRKILLSVGANNYKPPLERSKSAPKLMAIEEMCSEEDEEEMSTFGLNNGHTWTKENSPLKMCCKADDIFPSHTLGRRKCDRNRCLRKNTLEESRTNSSEDPLQRHLSLEVDDFPSLNDDVLHEEDEINERVAAADEPKSSDSFDSGYERASNRRSSGSNNRVSFRFSNVSEVSEQNSDRFTEVYTDAEDDNVFYCETDERQKIAQDQKNDNGDKSINDLEQLCAQANFLVLDSDEGSISSGCETASTVTSSDIEMSSLPCNITQNEADNKQEKVSVLQRVQSFEQLFTIEKNSSIRSSRSSLKSNFSSNKSLRNFHLATGSIDSEMTSSSPSDSACFSSSETGPASVSDEVSLVPLGEKHSNILAGVRRPYLRCSTFPPSDDDMCEAGYMDRSTESVDVCGTTDPLELDFGTNFENQSEQVGGDSDSACSVESGYSELLDSNNQNEELIGNTVMV